MSVIAAAKGTTTHGTYIIIVLGVLPTHHAVVQYIKLCLFLRGYFFFFRREFNIFLADNLTDHLLLLQVQVQLFLFDRESATNFTRGPKVGGSVLASKTFIFTLVRYCTSATGSWSLSLLYERTVNVAFFIGD